MNHFNKKRSYRKHHILWGGLCLLIILSGVVSLNIVYYMTAGLSNGAGAGIAIGRGALGVAITASDAEVGFEFDYNSHFSSQTKPFHFWFSLKGGGELLLVPLWVILLIPIGFWIFSLWRLKRLSGHNPH